MYIKKSEFPRAATLPDGTIMTQADLPPAETVRWMASRKSAVVKGLLCGLLAREDALRRYQLTGEELDSWVAAFRSAGEAALKVKATRGR